MLESAGENHAWGEGGDWGDFLDVLTLWKEIQKKIWQEQSLAL